MGCCVWVWKCALCSTHNQRQCLKLLEAGSLCLLLVHTLPASPTPTIAREWAVVLRCGGVKCEAHMLPKQCGRPRLLFVGLDLRKLGKSQRIIQTPEFAREWTVVLGSRGVHIEATRANEPIVTWVCDFALRTCMQHLIFSSITLRHHHACSGAGVLQFWFHSVDAKKRCMLKKPMPMN